MRPPAGVEISGGNGRTPRCSDIFWAGLMITSIESFLSRLRARIAWELLPSRFFVLSLLPKKSVCAEVGTYKGEFATSIVQATKPSD